ncbi:SURF1 family protein [Sinosporangium siamense]|uniref:SURF1-like protein n=1 Tax=Sinosporangium siamense TaxID=1367973 RepID=A0A919V5Q0_9ACTN|nr:SURF1 family protein [Sinosporangium siamense]GII91126.1 SURF1-like protein [Sinosporangium siamense]
MLRTLLSPRLAGLHVLLVVALVATWLLGRWQLGVFEESSRPLATGDPQPVAVADLTRQGAQIQAEVVGRLVTAEGTFDAARQLLVVNREPDVAAPGGAVSQGKGAWVLAPLTLPDGTAIPVVRGWVKDTASPAPAVPQGKVTVTGRLQPSQPVSSVQRRGEALSAGQVMTVSTPELINLWQGARLRDGFVVSTESAAALTPVKASPPQTEAVLTWRNLAYAAQWWIFGLFALFMWFHFVRDAIRSDRAAKDGSPGPGEGGGVPLDQAAAPIS